NSVRRAPAEALEQGAGDQGIMFGYATDETPELMPLPILLAHRLARTLAEHRKANRVSWLRPDSKTQVSVLYGPEGPIEVTDVLVSTQHAKDVGQEAIRDYVATPAVPAAPGGGNNRPTRLVGNPPGSSGQGGPGAAPGGT